MCSASPSSLCCAAERRVEKCPRPKLRGPRSRDPQRLEQARHFADKLPIARTTGRLYPAVTNPPHFFSPARRCPLPSPAAPAPIRRRRFDPPGQVHRSARLHNETPGIHNVRVKACVNRETPKCALSEFRIEIPEKAQEFEVKIGAQNLTSYARQFYNQQNEYLEAIAGDKIRLFAQISNHHQIAKLEYRWDFEGDGTWNTPFGASTNQEHIYDRAGKYAPRVEVRKIRDIEQDILQSDTMTIEVSDNNDPEGWIDFGAEKICYQGDTITATAKVYDQESSSNVLKVRWDFDNDGIWDTDLSTAKTHQYTLRTEGKQSMRIQIVDPGGKSISVRKTFVVEPSPQVTAAVDVSSKIGFVGQPMQFDASRSLGHNLGYQWKTFGEPDDYGNSGKIISKIFRYPGKKEITLTIVDQLGQSAKVSFEVEVKKPAPPVAPATPQFTQTNAPQGSKGGTGGLYIPVNTDFDFLNVYQ